MILATAIILGVLFAGGLYLVRLVVLPARRIADAAERIETGDLSARVPENVGAGEIRRMSAAFNRMAESVEEATRERAEAEQIKDEFFALISHELRTPLTSIVGYAELLLEDSEGRMELAQQRKFIDVINRNSKRLLRLVGDMLFIARMEAGHLELESADVDVAAVARESVETFEPRAERGGVELDAEIAEVGGIRGDGGRLGQALDNLISNAIKFTPRGGHVMVRASREASSIVLEVTDDGSGISQAEQERLFERFYRTEGAQRRHVEGTGLGLSIVQAIVNGHQGRIAIDSQVGQGTTFRIALPAEVPEAAPAR
jgi:signal transduction histidine kinase